MLILHSLSIFEWNQRSWNCRRAWEKNLQNMQMCWLSLMRSCCCCLNNDSSLASLSRHIHFFDIAFFLMTWPEIKTCVRTYSNTDDDSHFSISVDMFFCCKNYCITQIKNHDYYITIHIPNRNHPATLSLSFPRTSTSWTETRGTLKLTVP